MNRSTKRNILIVTLAVVVPWMILSLCEFLVAERGGIYQAGRSWCVEGFAGRYGALESEATEQTGQHVAWETQFFCGPLRLSFPFRAPVAVRVLALWVALPVSVGLFLRLREHVRRHTQRA
jgi:hypothetical protein